MGKEIKKYDVFLSYKSDDALWVKKLKNDLEAYGIKVWLDQENIRPGDLFLEALEDGINSSRVVLIVVTPKSIDSKWVRREAARAFSLSTENNTRIIPILLEGIPKPGFLADLEHVDFRDKENYDRSLTKLIWPGITGKKIQMVGVGDVGGRQWNVLRKTCSEFGVEFVGEEDLDRVRWPGISRSYPNLADYGDPFDPEVQVVLVVDPFEGLEDLENKYRRNPPIDYFNFIFHNRMATKGKVNELIFLLFCHNEEWENFPLTIDVSRLNDKFDNYLMGYTPDEIKRRYSHYFRVEFAKEESIKLVTSFDQVWRRIQREAIVGKPPY
ncbi:MAG: toll/interleukin-1 receptor domain-containing protein [Bacteroidota bacterium]